MSPGQVEIYLAIVLKEFPRWACLAPTGYGKSVAVALGVIIRVCVFRDPFVIASVKFGTSGIIMKIVIDHLFDDPMFLRDLQIDESSELDRLRRDRKKTSLTFKRGGQLRVVSLHGSDENVSQTIGEHEPNIILDESPLLTPAKYLQVLKILEGTGDYNTTFLFELGNAVNRNHFMQNVLYNPDYYKINISPEQAIAEGRLDQKSLDERRGLPFFEQFYLNQFPNEEAVDEKGYRQLLTTEEIEKAQEHAVELTDERMALGGDIAGGGDKNAFVIRQVDHAWIETSNRSNDTMANCITVTETIDKYTVTLDKQKVRLLKPEQVFLDDIGIGRGVTDRLQEMKDDHNRNYYVQGISVGEKADDPTRFMNIKAENYWRMRMWVKAGGRLQRAKEWEQLAWIRYKITTDKVLQIEPKKDLKARTGKSPDYAEALMLTFASGSPEPGLTLLDI